MTTTGIVNQFKQDYPGRTILRLPEDNPTEIICETDPTSEHPEYSTIVAAEIQSTAHYHLKSVETYEVLEGELTLHVDDKTIVLKQGDMHTIQPEQVHYCTGELTIIKVTSRPGWTAEDHILVKNNP